MEKQLLSFGGWLTVSSCINPILMQADRFFIGILISASAVAIYAIPYEVVIRSLIIVGAISNVAFPSLSKLVSSQPAKVHATFTSWLLRVAVAMFFTTTAIAIVLPIVLPWWIGENLPSVSIRVGQLLCIGVFANSLGCMYLTLVHAYGRTDLTAKAQLAELPIFLGSLYVLVLHFGVEGAATAWVGRVVLDAVVMGLISQFLERRRPSSVNSQHV